MQYEIVVTGGTLQFDDDSYSYFLEIYLNDVFIELECQLNFDSSEAAEKLAMECIDKLPEIIQSALKDDKPGLIHKFCADYRLVQTNRKDMFKSLAETGFGSGEEDPEPTLH